jgi:hypothetical protein
MVFRHDDPVFDGIAGAGTMRVWVQVSRWMLTDPKQVTAAKPLGHVVAGEERLAKVLHLNVKTIRGHLRRLQSAGLLVLWQAPRRGAILPSGAGEWKGLATEFLVVPMAHEAVVASVLARETGSQRPPRAPNVQKTPRVRGADGRFSRSDHDATGKPAPVATGKPAPVATGVPLPAFKTLGDETLNDETLNQGDTCVSDIGNRRAYQALREAEEAGEIPGLTLGERAGIAHAITAVVDQDQHKIEAVIAEAAQEWHPSWGGQPLDDADPDQIREVFSCVLGIDARQFWEIVNEQSADRRVHGSGA